MSEKGISQHKRLAMGDKVNKYAKGGMVTPRVGGGSLKPKVPSYADGDVAGSETPAFVSRAGVKHKGLSSGGKAKK